jgi:hypothetical protein
MSLASDPWLLRNTIGKTSSVYCVPYEFTSKTVSSVSFLNASRNRPAILMFNSKSSAEQFRNNYLSNILVCDTSNHTWNSFGVTEMSDVDTFTEVRYQVQLDNCDYERNIIYPSYDIMPQKLTNMENDILMTLSLCAYAIYFYVESITSKNNTLEMRGLLINPCGSISDTDTDARFRQEYILTHLNQMANE